MEFINFKTKRSELEKIHRSLNSLYYGRGFSTNTLKAIHYNFLVVENEVKKLKQTISSTPIHPEIKKMWDDVMAAWEQFRELHKDKFANVKDDQSCPNELIPAWDEKMKSVQANYPEATKIEEEMLAEQENFLSEEITLKIAITNSFTGVSPAEYNENMFMFK